VSKKEPRYYISGENIPGLLIMQSLIRGHRVIENQLHRHLDVTFKEDQCGAGTGSALENPATVRKFALQMIFQANDKLSLKKRQYKAALDMGYMKKTLKS
jgi:hypothetical protein